MKYYFMEDSSGYDYPVCQEDAIELPQEIIADYSRCALGYASAAVKHYLDILGRGNERHFSFKVILIDAPGVPLYAENGKEYYQLVDRIDVFGFGGESWYECGESEEGE